MIPNVRSRWVPIAVVLVSMIAALAGAQVPAAAAAPVAVLVYADDMREVEVLDFTGAPLEYVDFGTEILIGFGIRTGGSGAELRLEPNGSILWIGEDTFVKIEELQGLPNTQTNSAALVWGRIRFVAATVAGQNYRITTPSAVIGVRGTDFAVSVGEERIATVAVERGVVEVFDPFSQQIEQLGAGEALTAREQLLARIDDERSSVRRLVREAEFVVADITEVPATPRGEYESTFDYFLDIDREAFREFFADEDYFDDYREYLQRYRSYYESEMEEFQAILEREEAAFREEREASERAAGEEERSFQEWLEGN